MSMIFVHLTRKPSSTRVLVAQRMEGNGVLQNEVPKQERPRLQWQLVDSHHAFCSWSMLESRRAIERTSKRLRRLDAAGWTRTLTGSSRPRRIEVGTNEPCGRPRDRRLHDRPELAPRVTSSSSSCMNVSPIASAAPVPAASRASFEG